MSTMLHDAVYGHTMKGPEKAVLLFLAWKANDVGGDCFPSLDTISQSTSLGRSTVKRALKSLESDRWLHAITGTQSKRYELNAARILSDPAQVARDIEGSRVDPVQSGPGPQRANEGSRADPEIQGKDNTLSQTRASGSKKGPLPDDWQPEPFGDDTKCAKIIAEWDAETLEIEIEKFRASHGARDTRFSSWQQAWATWVLRSRQYGGGNGTRTNGNRGNSATRPGGRDGFLEALDGPDGFDEDAGETGRSDDNPAASTIDGRSTYLRAV